MYIYIHIYIIYDYMDLLYIVYLQILHQSMAVLCYHNSLRYLSTPSSIHSNLFHLLSLLILSHEYMHTCIYCVTLNVFSCIFFTSFFLYLNRHLEYCYLQKNYKYKNSFVYQHIVRIKFLDIVILKLPHKICYQGYQL